MVRTYIPLPQLINRYGNIGRILASGGAKKQISFDAYGAFAEVAADGDKHQIWFICDGSETRLQIAGYRDIWNGIWDLYINGVLDSSGYDDYAGGMAYIRRDITLSQPILWGSNMIELRINGKNVLSNDYFVTISGVAIQ